MLLSDIINNRNLCFARYFYQISLTGRSYRHFQLEKLYKAKRFHRWPTELDRKVKDSIREGYRGTALIKKILYEDGVRISRKGINRRILLLEQQK